MTLDKPAEVEEVGTQILAAAMRVHSALGPRLLEGAYETCLANDLVRLGLRVERQMTLPLISHKSSRTSGSGNTHWAIC